MRAHEVVFVNECNETIYVGIVQNAGQKLINNGGFRLDHGDKDTVELPFGREGRFWGRTQCQEWGEMCETGRCGENWMHCLGDHPGAGPVTFVDVRLDKQGNGADYYSVNLVSGYNIPIQVHPVNGTFQNVDGGVENYCTWAGCENDLNYICPAELQAFGSKGQLVGCRSPCDAFQEDEYCCQGKYESADTCPSFSYADTFKQSCRRATSYALDQTMAGFTCIGKDYVANKTLVDKTSSGSAYKVTLCPGGEGTSLQWLPESAAIPSFGLRQVGLVVATIILSARWLLL
jgi:hypothetical protein